jgi:hypothetical protein
MLFNLGLHVESSSKISMPVHLSVLFFFKYKSVCICFYEYACLLSASELRTTDFACRQFGTFSSAVTNWFYTRKWISRGGFWPPLAIRPSSEHSKCEIILLFVPKEILNSKIVAEQTDFPPPPTVFYVLKCFTKVMQCKVTVLIFPQMMFPSTLARHQLSIVGISCHSHRLSFTRREVHRGKQTVGAHMVMRWSRNYFTTDSQSRLRHFSRQSVHRWRLGCHLYAPAAPLY